MSAEAPRNSDGGLSGFLGRLFGVPVQPPTSRVVQVPPGLEDFADKIRQGISNQQVVDRQRLLEYERLMKERRAVEVKKQAQAEAKERELEYQQRVKTERAATEGAKILKDFQIAERLETIRQTVWEGKGEINTLEPYFVFSYMDDWDRIRDKIWRGEIHDYKQPPISTYDLLGGLELVFKYPNVMWNETRESGDGTTTTSSYYPSPETKPRKFDDKVSLRVHIHDNQGEPEEYRKIIRISAVAPFLRGGQETDVTIPVNAENAKTLLIEALVEDCAHRKTQAFIPSMAEEIGRRRLESLKKDRSFSYA